MNISLKENIFNSILFNSVPIPGTVPAWWWLELGCEEIAWLSKCWQWREGLGCFKYRLPYSLVRKGCFEYWSSKSDDAWGVPWILIIKIWWCVRGALNTYYQNPMICAEYFKYWISTSDDAWGGCFEYWSHKSDDVWGVLCIPVLYQNSDDAWGGCFEYLLIIKSKSWWWHHRCLELW